MKAWGWLGVAACAMALAMPVSAAAKPGYGVFLPYRSFSATLPKSNGYEVTLRTFHNWVEMNFYRNEQVAIYLAKGKVSLDEIDVDFGRFGRVQVQFTGHRIRGESLFPGCRGRRPIKARGQLEGKIDFHGEENFATVSSFRARASYDRGFKEVCYVGPQHHKGHKELLDVLEVTGRTAGDQLVGLRATNWEAVGYPVITATTWDRIGKVTAVKITSAFEESSLLEFSPNSGQPKAVTMRPAPPFRGSASFVAQADRAAEWTGDLQVPFPGLGTVDLTGAGFHAYACRHHLSEQSQTCKQRQERAEPSTAAAPTPSPWRWPGFPR